MSKNLSVGLVIDANVKSLDDLNKLIDELEQSGENVERLRKRSKRLGDEWDNLNTAEQSQRFRRLKEAVSKVGSETERTARSTNKLRNQGDVTKAMRSGIERTSTSAAKLKTKLGAVAAAVTAAFATSAVVRFFSSAVRGAASLESQLDKVQAVGGATADEMAQIKAKSEELGATTKYTATQAAEGFEILARAGLKANESIETIPAVLDLAQAAGIELTESAGYITKTLAGFNYEVTESGRVADVLAKAAASANTDVSGLGQALSYAAPSAAALGLSVEDTVAIIAKFADAGIDASRAGTALNSILSQFSNPASTFRKSLAEIGITTNDFNQALRELAASGKVGQKAILAVGQEAGPALKALLAQGIPALDELTHSLGNSAGSAKAMAQTMNNNLFGALRGLSSIWDTIKNKLGEPLLGFIKEQVDDLTLRLQTFVADGSIDKIAEKFANWFKQTVRDFRAFFAEFKIEEIGTRISNFGKSASSAFETVTAAFSTFYNAFVTGLKTINGILLKVGEYFSAFVSKVASAYAYLAEVAASMGVITKETAAKVREYANTMSDAAEDFKQRASSAFESAAQSGEKLIESYEKLTGAQQKTSNSTVANVDVINDARTAYTLLAKEIDELAKKQRDLVFLQQTETAEYREVTAAVAEKTTAQKALGESIKGNEDAINSAKLAYAQLFQEVSNLEAKQRDFIFLQQAESDAAKATTTALAEKKAELAALSELIGTTASANADAVAAEEKLASAQKETAESAKSKGQAQQNVAKQTEKSSESTKKATTATKESTEATEKSAKASAEAANVNEKSAKASDDVAKSAQGQKSAMQGLLEIAERYKTRFAESTTTLEAFETGLDRAFNPKGVTTFNAVVDDLNLAIQHAERKFQLYKTSADEAEESTRTLAEQTASGKVNMQDLALASQRAEQGVGYLNDATLDKLNGAIKAAEDRMNSLKKSSEDALKAMNERLLRAQGNTDEIEKNRYEEELKKLQEALEEARKRNDLDSISNYSSAIEKLRKAYLEEQKQRDERKAREAEKQSNDKPSSSSSGGGSGGASSGSTTPIIINAGNQTARFDAPEALASQFGTELGKFVGGLRQTIERDVTERTASAFTAQLVEMQKIKENTN